MKRALTIFAISLGILAANGAAEAKGNKNTVLLRAGLPGFGLTVSVTPKNQVQGVVRRFGFPVAKFNGPVTSVRDAKKTHFALRTAAPMTSGSFRNNLHPSEERVDTSKQIVGLARSITVSRDMRDGNRGRPSGTLIVNYLKKGVDPTGLRGVPASFYPITHVNQKALQDLNARLKQ